MPNDQRPPCNIVICSDGTGNAGGRTNGSNVWRIRQAVAESTVPGYGQKPRRQIVIYEDGVGSETSTPLKVIGGAFGWGMTRDIKSLYGRLIREFQPGDQIYLFGFSRGAFTARTLANLLHVCGIADCWEKDSQGKRVRRTPEDIDALVDKAVDIYKKRHGKPGDCSLFRETFGLAWPDSDSGESLKREKGRFPIRFVGMWDTVDALGLPFDNTTQWLANKGMRGFRLNLKRPDAAKWWDWEDDLHEDVQNAFHAMAVDDERQTFHPVLWLEHDPKTREPKNSSGFVHGGTRKVEQVWFAGAHANVGGGYPKDQLAHVSLCWMMRHASREGLAFDLQKWQEYEQQRDELGKLYDSRAGGGAFYRYKPRRITELAEQVGIGVEDDAGKKTRPPLIHSSVLNRIRWTTRGYAPTGLPQVGEYAQVGDPAQRTVIATCNRVSEFDPGGTPPEFDSSSRPVCRYEKKCKHCSVEQPREKQLELSGKAKETRSEIQEEVFDLVALRRVLFYLMYLFVLIGIVGAIYLENRYPLRSAHVLAADPKVWAGASVILLATFLMKHLMRPIRDMRAANGAVEVTGPHRWGKLLFVTGWVAVILILFETTIGALLTSMAPDLVAAEVDAVMTRTTAYLGIAFFIWFILAGTSANRHGIREWNVYGWQLALGRCAKKPRDSPWLRFAKRRRGPKMGATGRFVERYVVPTAALGVLGALLCVVVCNEYHATRKKANVDYHASQPEKSKADDSEKNADPAVLGTVIPFEVEKILGTKVMLEKGRRYVVMLTPDGFRSRAFEPGKRLPESKYLHLRGIIGGPLEETFPVADGVPFTALESGELFVFISKGSQKFAGFTGPAFVRVELVKESTATSGDGLDAGEKPDS